MSGVGLIDTPNQSRSGGDSNILRGERLPFRLRVHYRHGLLKVVIHTPAELGQDIAFVTRHRVRLVVDDEAVPLADLVPDVVSQPSKFVETQVFKDVDIILAEDICGVGSGLLFLTLKVPLRDLLLIVDPPDVRVLVHQ